MSENLQKIIDRVKAGNHTQEDVLAIVSEIYAGKLVLASGSGAVAIGGDAANARIATGNQNVIGDRNTVIYIEGAESDVIQSVVDRYSGINNTFQRLFPPSASSAVDWDWGLKLLKQKQLPEIRKRLTDTLGRDRILMDVSIEERQNWVNRSPLAADRTLQINGEDCGTLDANKMLIETFGRDDIEGKLLILGPPGAGKTTALLSLAEQLVEGAISQPKTVILVIFELSTWQNDNQSIQDWLIEQLYDLHGGNRKSKLYEQWLERQVLLPLLDGLDELGLERQKKCTEKLNEFAEHYPQMVVCCRVKEFEAVDIKLRNLRGAVCLQPLSDLQIQNYLDTLKRPELWEAIQTTPSLQAMLEPTTEGDPGLLRVPLFVKLVVDVYDPQQPISSKADLLDKYIDRQLSFDKREIDRRKELKEYQWEYKTVKLEPDWKKTCRNLSWLARSLQAHNNVSFFIEKMQVSWLKSINLKHSYFLTSCLINCLILSLVGGCIGRATIGLFEGMTISLIGGMTISLMVYLIVGVDQVSDRNEQGDFGLVEAFQISISKDIVQKIVVTLINDIILGLSKGVILGLILGLFYSSISGFIAGLIIGMIGGLIRGIILGLIRNLKQELKMRTYPNQGIWNSVKNTIFITTILCLLSIFIILSLGLIHLWWVGLLMACLLGFRTGGAIVCLNHLSIRIVLWKSGLPWNFARFLNYCIERRLLVRVGGSYRFLHRELLDHFAQSSR